MNDPVAAAWTATVYVAFGCVLTVGMLSLFAAGAVVARGAMWLEKRVSPALAIFVAIVVTWAIGWLAIFLSAWCCGVPVR